MPNIQIDRIVSFSSEDEKHRAENVLNTESNKVWKCKETGEKKAVLMLQLKEPSVISQIHIGNAHSAFIEVLVGRSTFQDDEYKLLLMTSSFMTPLDSRQSLNSTRMRLFEENNLQSPTCKERWDRVKVVCTQPFNRHVQYGLTFINLITFKTSENVSTPARVLDRLIMRPENEDETCKPSLPSSSQSKSTDENADTNNVDSIDTKIKENLENMKKRGKTSSTPMDVDSMKKNQRNIMSKTDLDSDDSSESRKEKRKNVSVDSDDEEVNNEVAAKPPSPKIKKTSDKSPVSHSSQESSPSTSNVVRGAKKKNGPCANEGYSESFLKKHKVYNTKPFGQLMDGVVFAMSGYVNPQRADLRSKAIEMGAKYKPDWAPGCTHLICAFKNTPKYNQVRGSGKIVKSQWIEDCHRLRKFIPWRRYALDQKDKNESESEEEIIETSAITNRYLEALHATPTQILKKVKNYISSGSDTDDEIERVTNTLKNRSPKKTDGSQSAISNQSSNSQTSGKEEKPVKIKSDEPDLNQPSTSKANISTKSSEMSIYDQDTDVEEDCEPEEMSADLDELPDFFKSIKFYLIDNEWGDDKRALVMRYINAYKGSVVDRKEDASYLICDAAEDHEIKPENKLLKVVSSKWIFECNDARRLLDV